MELVNYKDINKGCLISTFDVKIAEWGLTFRGCSFFRKDNRTWIALPSKEYEKDGQRKSFAVVCFDKDKHNRFQQACIDKIGRGEFSRKTENQNSSGTLPF